MTTSSFELAEILDAIAETIVVLSPDGVTLYANRAVLDYAGLTMIVTEQHDRDRRKIVEANAGGPDAMRPRKLEWALAVGVHRIG